MGNEHIPDQPKDDYKASDIMVFFSYDHLPEPMKTTSKSIGDIADWIDRTLPNGAEKSVALRKLLEAKDAAVRAVIGYKFEDRGMKLNF